MDIYKPLVALLAIVNPVGVVPFFIHFTAAFSRQQRRRTILVSACTAGIVIALSALFGLKIIEFFGISLASFQVGGGCLLLISSLQMLNAQPAEARKEDVSEGNSKADAGAKIAPGGPSAPAAGQRAPKRARWPYTPVWELPTPEEGDLVVVLFERLEVEGVSRAAGLGHVTHPLARLRHHHMDVHEGIGQVLVQRGDDGRAPGEVGHKVAVHHVEVELVGAGGEHALRLASEVGEIAREHRW